MNVVIGVGNTHRRDDGVGPAVAAAVAADCPAGVRVVTCVVEPTAILDAWDGADLAVVIDAAGGEDALPGRVRRAAIEEVAGSGALTSHDLNLVQTYELARVLDRAPRRVVRRQCRRRRPRVRRRAESLLWPRLSRRRWRSCAPS